MTWEQKLQAAQALGPVSLKMRHPGDWYVEDHFEICRGPIGESSPCNGTTPEAAVEKLWHWLCSQDHDGVSVLGSDRRKFRYKWNGFMWVDVTDPAHAVLTQ